MGEHAKVVPKKLKLAGEEIELEEGDFLIQCLPDEKLVFLPDFKAEFPACLIRIFRVEDFDEKHSTIWQTAEGICLKKQKELASKFWGYDGTLTLEKVMNITLEKIAPACFKKRKTAYGLVKKDDFKTVISTLSGKINLP